MVEIVQLKEAIEKNAGMAELQLESAYDRTLFVFMITKVNVLRGAGLGEGLSRTSVLVERLRILETRTREGGGAELVVIGDKGAKSVSLLEAATGLSLENMRSSMHRWQTVGVAELEGGVRAMVLGRGKKVWRTKDPKPDWSRAELLAYLASAEWSLEFKRRLPPVRLELELSGAWQTGASLQVDGPAGRLRHASLPEISAACRPCVEGGTGRFGHLRGKSEGAQIVFWPGHSVCSA